jgi:geranylgeranyl pyrophosphate synthase
MLDHIEITPQATRVAVAAIINGGGKQLRPALTLLSSHICEADRGKALVSAAAVEMLHTATLIHDDLIDQTLIRRGVETLNAAWTPAATVLAGDIVFALAAKLISHSESPRLVRRFAETLETICAGEIQQMFEGHGVIPPIEAYYARIFAKTASLFSLCVETGAILAGCSDAEAQRARRFGKLLGEAFQIADDVLDLMGDTAVLGKPVGTDLRQGLVTLPVLRYYERHPDDARLQMVLNVEADEQSFLALIHDIQASDAPEWAMQQAETHIEEALDLLNVHPDTPYRRAMEEIARFSVRRRH